MSPRVRSTTSLRYALDARNRLTIIDAQEALQPRRILEGRIHTDEANRFFYDVDASVGPGGDAGPHTIKLDGTWQLTDNHELAFTLHEGERRQRQTLYLKGALVQADAHALVFALRRSETEDLLAAQRLTLSGRWEADAKNRLNFLVEKSDGSEDRLTLQGGWEVGPHHELLYRYRRHSRGVRTRDEHTLFFTGHWDITATDQLVYRVGGSADSACTFTVSLRSPSLLASEGRIVYEVGIGVAEGRAQPTRVALLGTWKLNRDLSVSFEIPYAGGRVQAIRFEGVAALSPRDRVAVALRSDRHEDLGLTVMFTRQLVRDANLFLRLQKSAEETSVIGGIQVRF